MPICNNKIDIHAHAVVTSCPNLDFVGLPTPENLLGKCHPDSEAGLMLITSII